MVRGKFILCENSCRRWRYFCLTLTMVPLRWGAGYPSFQIGRSIRLCVLVVLGLCFLCPVPLEFWKTEVRVYLRQRAIRQKVAEGTQLFHKFFWPGNFLFSCSFFGEFKTIKNFIHDCSVFDLWGIEQGISSYYSWKWNSCGNIFLNAKLFELYIKIKTLFQQDLIN